MDGFVQKIKELLPSVIDYKIVTEEELKDLLMFYESELSNRTKISHYEFFYDWVASAIGGKNKSKAFLVFYNNALEELFVLLGNSFPHAIVTKIRDSILTKQESYLDSLGEILLIWYLLKNYKGQYEFLGTDFKLGNGKDCDVAFKAGNHIQLIEIKNIHNLINKNLEVTIKKRIEGKMSDKTKQLHQIQSYFSIVHPNCNVTLSVLLFIWEDYVDLANQSFDSVKLKNELGDDFLPPITLVCQVENEDYYWDICPLSEIVNRTMKCID